MNYLTGTLFSPLLFLPGVILRYLPFKSFTDKKQKIVLSVLYAVALIVNACLWFLRGKYSGSLDVSFLKADMIAFPFILIFVNAAVIRGRIKEHLFTCGIVVLFEYMNTTLSLFISNLISHFHVSENPFKFYVIFYVALQIIFIPLTYKLLNITVTQFLNFEKNDYFSIIWFIPTSMILVCYFTVYGDETINTLPPFIGRLFLMVSAIIICINLARDYLRMTEQLETKKQLSMQKEYYTELSMQVEKARQTRHDIKHHIASLQHFIDTDDKKGMKLYCDEYSAAVSGDRIPYTGNSAADGVLYHYSEKAKSKNITFEIKGTIKSNSIDDTNLCVLLGNALDNAVTACETAEKEKHISVISESDDFMLSIIIVNSFDGIVKMKENKIMSRKEKDRYGVGLESMKKIAEKCGGTMEISYDESNFKVIFLLPIKK